MSSTPVTVASPASVPLGETPGEVAERENVRQEERNIWALAMHFLLVRTAWIFKTESVIMPAFMDTLSGAGWLRGCLPWLNRFGQSIPPLLYADRLKHAPYKKRILALTTQGMAVPFALLSLIWFCRDWLTESALPPLFLALYALFFCMTGLNQLVAGTLSGKLVRPARRGRLMSLGGIFGSIMAITCAWYLLRSWLTLEDGGFGWIFGFTALGFSLSGLIVVFVREQRDDYPPRPRRSLRAPFVDAWNLVRQDADFRRLNLAGGLFISGQFLFPHYQALGRTMPGFAATDMMIWVIAQNASVGFISVFCGWVADRWGNRLALRLMFLLSTLAPLLAVLLNGPWSAWGSRYFWVTFVLLGAVPVTFKTLSNYSLELAPPQDHPRYLSTLTICISLPMTLSPLVGWLVSRLGFNPVFLAVAGLVLLSAGMTFFLIEPRQRRSV